MIMPRFGHAGSTGLDIGSRSIKAVQMNGSGVAASVTLPRSGPPGMLEDGELAALAEALRRRPFRPSPVVIAVPAQSLLSAILELPPRSSGAPIEQLAHAELARRHGADAAALEKAVWDLPTPARAANRTYVMAVACPRAEADAMIDRLESRRLPVRAIEIHATAAVRACMPLLEQAARSGAVLDLGWSAARLALVYQGTIVYERTMPRCGVRALAEALASQADGDAAAAEQRLLREGMPAQAPATSGLWAQADALASETAVPLSYLASQYPDAAVRRLLVCGGGAKIGGLAQRLAQQLEVDAVVVDPATICGEGSPADASLVAAMGLAQYGAR